MDTSCCQTRGEARRLSADSRQAALSSGQFWLWVKALMSLPENGILRLEIPSAGGAPGSWTFVTDNEL